MASASGTLNLDQSTVAYNSAFGSPGSYADFGYSGGRAEGGGLYIARGMVYINQSSVYSNLAAGGDGADDFWSDPLYARGGDGGGANGGGIRVAGGTLEVRQSTFGGNRAVGGSLWFSVVKREGAPRLSRRGAPLPCRLSCSEPATEESIPP